MTMKMMTFREIRRHDYPLIVLLYPLLLLLLLELVVLSLILRAPDIWPSRTFLDAPPCLSTGLYPVALGLVILSL